MDGPSPLYSKILFGHVGVLRVSGGVKSKQNFRVLSSQNEFRVEFPQINRSFFLKGNSRDRFPHIFLTPKKQFNSSSRKLMM